MAKFNGAKTSLAIASAFDAIGRSADGTVMPQSASNKEAIAFEFFVASRLRSQANSRCDEAKAAAIEAGVIDPEGDPGTEIVAYDGDYVAITRIIKQPAQRFDKTKAAVALRKSGVSQERIDKAWETATTENKAAVEFRCAPK